VDRSLVDRYYDPSTGQFITVDPDVSETGEPYAYAGGDPANASDPSGAHLCWGWSCWSSGYSNAWHHPLETAELAGAIALGVVATVATGGLAAAAFGELGFTAAGFSTAALYLGAGTTFETGDALATDELGSEETGALGPPSAAEAQQLVQGADPVGSALKDDVYHRAAVFASENIASGGSVYRIVGGDGVEVTLIQAPGEVNDVSGRFEWIVNDQSQLTHQWFVKGGSINGLPITP
jgi:hypothetical protein